MDRLWIAGVLAVVIGACGGGGGSSPSAGAASSDAAVSEGRGMAGAGATFESDCADGSCLECRGEIDGMAVRFAVVLAGNEITTMCRVGDESARETQPASEHYHTCGVGDDYRFEVFNGKVPDSAAVWRGGRGHELDCVGVDP